MFSNVTPKTALMYAMKAYENPQCVSTEEFSEDYKRFKYVKRLCRRYSSDSHRDRLMLNHLILLMNVFGVEATSRLLFLKCEGDEHSFRVLKPFLMYLNALPDVVCGIEGQNIVTSNIPMDERIYNRLCAL